MSPLGHKEICGLDVAMNNSLAVGCVQGVCNLDADIEQRLRLESPAKDHFPQSLCRYRAKTPARVAGQGSLPAESCLPDIPSPERSDPGARQFREWCRYWGDSVQTRRALHAGSAPATADRSPGCRAETLGQQRGWAVMPWPVQRSP